jgi:hypothetical protein
LVTSAQNERKNPGRLTLRVSRRGAGGVKEVVTENRSKTKQKKETRNKCQQKKETEKGNEYQYLSR